MAISREVGEAFDRQNFVANAVLPDNKDIFVGKIDGLPIARQTTALIALLSPLATFRLNIRAIEKAFVRPLIFILLCAFLGLTQPVLRHDYQNPTCLCDL